MCHYAYICFMIVMVEDDKCSTFTDMGSLADYLSISRHTVVNWFRNANYRDCDGFTVWKVLFHYGSNRIGNPNPCESFKKNIIRNGYLE